MMPGDKISIWAHTSLPGLVSGQCGHTGYNPATGLIMQSLVKNNYIYIKYLKLSETMAKQGGNEARKHRSEDARKQ